MTEGPKDALGAFKKHVTDPAVKHDLGHANAIQAADEQLRAELAQKLQKNPDLAEVIKMRKLRQTALSFIKSHGPRAFNNMPPELQEAMLWDDPGNG